MAQIPFLPTPSFPIPSSPALPAHHFLATHLVALGSNEVCFGLVPTSKAATNQDAAEPRVSQDVTSGSTLSMRMQSKQGGLVMMGRRCSPSGTKRHQSFWSGSASTRARWVKAFMVVCAGLHLSSSVFADVCAGTCWELVTMLLACSSSRGIVCHPRCMEAYCPPNRYGSITVVAC